MKEAFVNICGIPTHIITWGRWIEEPLDDVKEIIICVTGNPGLPGFYTEFLGLMHKHLGEKYPIWVIGHLGHDIPSEDGNQMIPQLKGNEKYFNLTGQIKHKLEFVEKYVPPHAKIHLIGHSIGAWMILQMLEELDLKKRIKKCYLLFPTIERMVESPNGWIFTRIALPLYSLFGFLITIFNIFPNVVKVLLIYMYFYFSSIPKHFIGTVLKYTNRSVMEKVVFLAEDEMTTVRSLPRETIQNNLGLLKLFYGANDGWVPLKYYKQLKESMPNIDAELDTRKIEHSFVLNYSHSMSMIVGDMVKQYSDISK